ncbi:MAG: DUF2089 family protein [Pirellulales bacterium]
MFNSQLDKINKAKVEPMPVTNLCPYCQHSMAVSRMTCHECAVSIDAVFPSPRLANLPTEHQRFIEIFVLASGNLKQIAEQAGVSYPTVRSRLDKVIDSLRQEIARTQQIRGLSLDAVHETPLDADEAARIIKAV